MSLVEIWHKFRRGLIEAFPSWVDLRTLGQSRLVQLTAIAPVIGGLIFINDQTAELLKSTLVGEGIATFPAPLLGFIPIPRLHLTYLGLAIVGVGSLVFGFRCPPIVRRYGSASEWLIGEDRFFGRSRTVREFRAVIDTYWANTKADGDSPGDDDTFRAKEGIFREPIVGYSQTQYDLLHELANDIFEKNPDVQSTQKLLHSPSILELPDDFVAESREGDEETDHSEFRRFYTGIRGVPDTEEIIATIYKSFPIERGLWSGWEDTAATSFKEQVVYLRFENYAAERMWSRGTVALCYFVGAIALAIPTLHTFVAIAIAAIRS